MSAGGTPYLQMGRRLRELNRPKDAEEYFRKALEENPLNGIALHELALSLYLQSNREPEALEVVANSLSIEPNDAMHHVLRASILNRLGRPGDALGAAREARRLDPNCVGAWIAEANSHLRWRDWAEAEKAARAALSIDANSTIAADLLIYTLQMQNRLEESDALISDLLARDPERSWTQLLAGGMALRKGDARRAEQHYRDALRLRPELDHAREGLLDSIRARSRLHRGLLRYGLWMAKKGERMRWALIWGFLGGVYILGSNWRKISPRLAIFIGVLYLICVLWIYVAKAVRDFFLLNDRFARYLLPPAAKHEAIVVGGSVILGLLLLSLGIFMPVWNMLTLSGVVFVLVSIPFSKAFATPSKTEKVVFGGMGACLLLGLFVFFVDPSASHLYFLFIPSLFCIGAAWLE